MALIYLYILHHVDSHFYDIDGAAFHFRSTFRLLIGTAQCFLYFIELRLTEIIFIGHNLTHFQQNYLSGVPNCDTPQNNQQKNMLYFYASIFIWRLIQSSFSS